MASYERTTLIQNQNQGFITGRGRRSRTRGRGRRSQTSRGRGRGGYNRRHDGSVNYMGKGARQGQRQRGQGPRTRHNYDKRMWPRTSKQQMDANQANEWNLRKGVIRREVKEYMMKTEMMTIEKGKEYAKRYKREEYEVAQREIQNAYGKIVHDTIKGQIKRLDKTRRMSVEAIKEWITSVYGESDTTVLKKLLYIMMKASGEDEKYIPMYEAIANDKTFIVRNKKTIDTYGLGHGFAWLDVGASLETLRRVSRPTHEIGFDPFARNNKKTKKYPDGETTFDALNEFKEKKNITRKNYECRYMLLLDMSREEMKKHINVVIGKEGKSIKEMDMLRICMTKDVEYTCEMMVNAMFRIGSSRSCLPKATEIDIILSNTVKPFLNLMRNVKGVNTKELELYFKLALDEIPDTTKVIELVLKKVVGYTMEVINETKSRMVEQVKAILLGEICGKMKRAGVVGRYITKLSKNEYDDWGLTTDCILRCVTQAELYSKKVMELLINMYNKLGEANENRAKYLIMNIFDEYTRRTGVEPIKKLKLQKNIQDKLEEKKKEETVEIMISYDHLNLEDIMTDLLYAIETKYKTVSTLDICEQVILNLVESYKILAHKEDIKRILEQLIENCERIKKMKLEEASKKVREHIEEIKIDSPKAEEILDEVEEVIKKLI